MRLIIPFIVLLFLIIYIIVECGMDTRDNSFDAQIDILRAR